MCGTSTPLCGTVLIRGLGFTIIIIIITIIIKIIIYMYTEVDRKKDPSRAAEAKGHAMELTERHN